MISKNKSDYNAFIKSDHVPIQMTDWWLDAVCGANKWNVLLDTKNRISYVYHRIKKKGVSIIENPKLSCYNGFWIEQGEISSEMLTGIISNIPPTDLIIQKNHYNIQPLDVFEKNGFKNTIRYSHIIDLAQNIDSIFESFKSNLKSDILKAEASLTSFTSNEVEKAYDLIAGSFSRQALGVPFTKELFYRLDAALESRGLRKIYFAKDDNDHLHACVYVTLYQGKASYIIGGAKAELRASNAQSLLIWEAIKDAKKQSCNYFDFTGSVMKSIESYFSAFCQQKISIPVLYKPRNKFYEMLLNWKGFV